MFLGIRRWWHHTQIELQLKRVTKFSDDDSRRALRAAEKLRYHVVCLTALVQSWIDSGRLPTPNLQELDELISKLQKEVDIETPLSTHDREIRRWVKWRFRISLEMFGGELLDRDRQDLFDTLFVDVVRDRWMFDRVRLIVDQRYIDERKKSLRGFSTETVDLIMKPCPYVIVIWQTIVDKQAVKEGWQQFQSLRAKLERFAEELLASGYPQDSARKQQSAWQTNFEAVFAKSDFKILLDKHAAYRQNTH